jgi:cob(I)alamin adenosyltransferase
LFYARAICRRAERSLVKLSIEEGFSRVSILKSQLLPYINRLSDYLFMLARKVNFDLEAKEDFWIGKRNKL